MEYPLQTDEKEHAVKILRSLESMRKQRRHCDFIIKVGSGEIHVHRNVVSASSDYFKAMLTHETLEKRSGVVEMKGINFRSVKKCVDYIYTGNASISEEDCEPMLHAGGLMQLATLCEKITALLQIQLNSRSFFRIKTIATKFGLKDLDKICNDFAMEHLAVIMKYEEFNKLDGEYVQFLISLKKPCPSNEVLKLEIINQWIEADLENRHQHITEMMSLVEFSMVSQGYIKHLMEDKVYRRLLDCLKIHSFSCFEDMSNMPRKPNTIVVFDVSCKTLTTYCPLAKSWTKMHKLPEDVAPRLWYTATVTQTHLYVLMSNGKVSRIHILEGRQWERMEDMHRPHGKNLSATACDEFIYVAGNEAVERYSEKRNEWEMIECDGIICNLSSLVELERCIYNIGGRKCNAQSVNKVHKFSHLSNSWSSVRPMLLQRETPATAAFDDKIYVAGGFDSERCHCLSYFESYDAKADCWTKLVSMTEPRDDFKLCIVEDRLFAVGSGDDQPCSIEMYSFEADKWEVVEEENPEMKINAQATVSAYFPGQNHHGKRNIPSIPEIKSHLIPADRLKE